MHTESRGCWDPDNGDCQATIASELMRRMKLMFRVDRIRMAALRHRVYRNLKWRSQ